MLPPWVAAAARLPVAFAQVREDPELDRWVVDRIGHAARVVMVASGGCTAAAMAATSNIDSLELVDPNPAQIALARLKMRLLETTSRDERLALMGHAYMDQAARAEVLGSTLAFLALDSDTVGPMDLVAALGPDHSGRYERLFATLAATLRGHEEALVRALGMEDPTAQGRHVAADTELGRVLDRAFDTVMALPNLVGLFGEGATRNPREPFSSHFAGRTRRAFGTFPASTNPFLWQMLLGRFPPRCEHAWLRAARSPRLPPVTWTVAPMVEALQAHAADCDVVHLSNILDWLSPEAARRTLDLAGAALRDDGWVIVRQLNSTLDIPALGARIRWHRESSEALLARDRSFFYRAIHVGQRA
jgi:S-adenosylmethionine-diacylglycerol 3-amino-3-carboxypropyl transferase